MTLDNLTDEYNAWTTLNNLPCISADELLYAGYCDECDKLEDGILLTPAQQSWLTSFTNRWEKAEWAEQGKDLG